MSVSELIKNYSKDELLAICSEKNIMCRKSWTKTKLAETLHAAGIGKKNKSSKQKSKNSSKKPSDKSSKKKSSKSRKNGKSKSDLDCNINQSDCEKSYKYKKSDITALAIKCGVDPSGTRKEICARIAAAIGGKPFTPTPIPTPSISTPTPHSHSFYFYPHSYFWKLL